MPVPDYLTYFFREGQTLLRSICEHDENTARRLLKKDLLWRAHSNYLDERLERERRLREAFIARGGQPVRTHPIYMILGDPPMGLNDLRMDYDYCVCLPLSAFDPRQISFTYPDSRFELPLDDPGRIRLGRAENPRVYRMDELAALIESYQVYVYNNHYIEAQVWDEAPARPYVGVERWQPCLMTVT